MQIESSTAPSNGAPASHQVPANAASLQTFVFALFFIFGGITSLNDVIIPKLKDLFTLSYAQVMLEKSELLLFVSRIGSMIVSLEGQIQTLCFLTLKRRLLRRRRWRLLSK